MSPFRWLIATIFGPECAIGTLAQQSGDACAAEYEASTVEDPLPAPELTAPHSRYQVVATDPPYKEMPSVDGLSSGVSDWEDFLHNDRRIT